MATEEKTDRLIGKVLDGRFRLDRLLGAGGMGKVYAGHQLSVERAVAVKVLREELSESETLAQRFFREAKVVASLRHPNVVGLVEFGRDAEHGLLYIAMEYVDGTSLGALLSHGRVPAELAVAVTRQVCSGLAEAHAAGVIHRDLKPDNIMLVTTAEGALSVKVLDFGIALPSGEEARLTSTGAVVGTPYYMAPEQSQDQPVTVRSDVYSMGVLLYEMLSGHLPFVADTPMAVLLKAITQPPPALSDVLAPEAQPPRELIELVEQMMQKAPDARPASVAEVGRRLDEIARKHALIPPSIAPGQALDSLTIERASDEFVFAATAASPVPATPATGPKVATADVGKTQPEVPESRRFKKRWLLIPAFPLFCCCLVLSGNKDKQKPELTSVPTIDAGAVERDTGGDKAAEPDLAPDNPDGTAAAVEAPTAPTSPIPPKSAAKPAPPPSQSPPPPRNLFRAQMRAGGICQVPRCDFLGLELPGAAVCQGESDCTAHCPISSCTQTCTGRATCKPFECDAGACNQICSGQAICKFTCKSGNCKQLCLEEANCDFSCAGGNCTQTCVGDQVTCKKSCAPGNCGG
jgi:serine/threonine-protein kinase